MESPEHERAAIERYMAWQAPDESMVHLEKVSSERVALPYSVELEEELRNYRGFLNSGGRLQIQAKDEIRELIHRSPDRLDAVIMAVAGRGYVSFGLAADMSGPVAF